MDHRPPVAPGGFVYLPGLGWRSVPSMGRRLGARVIDGLITAVIAAILLTPSLIVFIASLHDVCQSDPPPGTAACETEPSSAGLVLFLSSYLLIGLVGIAYEWLLIALLGATPGKRAVGIEVVRESGGRPGLAKSLIRLIVLAASSALCCVGYFSPFFDRSGRRQGWHDLASNTIVVTRGPV